MTSKSRYVFGAAIAGIALGSVPGLVQKAHAALVTNADFTFDSDTTIFPSTSIGTASTGSNSGTASSTFYNYGSVTGSSVGTLFAEVGTGSAIAVHSSTSAVYSTPVGNGSNKSFSANHFLAGDYYQFTVPTSAIMGILVSFDQTSSGSGPKAFSLQYSVGAVTGIAAAYTVGTTSFAASASNTAVSFGFNLASIPLLDNQSSVVFKLVDTDTTTATGGTDRLDNFSVAGSPVGVPEPAGLTLLTVAGAAALYRKRRPKA